MQIIIIILGVIVGLIVLLLIAALFVKKEYTVAQEITINKPKQMVFDYIKLLKNQDYYNKWVMSDPEKKTEFKGTDGTVGFSYAWDSAKKNAGQGIQSIKKVQDGECMDYEIVFIKPFEGIADTTFITEKISDNETRVRWSFDSAMKYPLNIMLVLLNMKERLRKDMEESLNKLKTILEK